MSDVVIKVEDVSKQYRLGKIGTGSLRHDLNRWWHTVRGKEDPYLKVGEVNDRTIKGESEYVWALKDINFEVRRGEVLGIIGRNGAGKSTLLKILSRTTLPTTGQIKTRGRIASLLEVGTGFHPELTGRENIFLNGAILGMRKAEIQRKLDEIIDFSGVERYIDTPVKRYSSGMYVRLAFAVAAHLESEILIVDEVLAVGDAEFQKKCLGKMGELSESEGRTVLLVSHNLEAIIHLCKTGISILNGSILLNSGINEVVKNYLGTSFINGFDNSDFLRREGSGKTRLKSFELIGKTEPKVNKSLLIRLKLTKQMPKKDLIISISFFDEKLNLLVYFVSDETIIEFSSIGTTMTDCVDLEIEELRLRPGNYLVRVIIHEFDTSSKNTCDVVEVAAKIQVASADFYNSGKILRNHNLGGLLKAKFNFN